MNCDRGRRLLLPTVHRIENILKSGKTAEEVPEAEMSDFTQLIEEADGINKLKALQSCFNDEINGWATKILQTYFDYEEVGEGK